MSGALPPSCSTKKAAKREYILACAKHIFATRGVVETTMQDIAQAAGVSKGALYLLFSSKDELYLELATVAAKGLLESLKQATGCATGYDEARALMHAYASFHMNDVLLSRLALAWLAPGVHIDESLPVALEYRQVVVEAMRISVDAFVRGQQDGSIRSDIDASRTTAQLWGSVVGLLIVGSKAIDDGPLPPQVNRVLWSELGSNTVTPATCATERAVDEFIELVMSAIKSPTMATVGDTKR